MSRILQTISFQKVKLLDWIVILFSLGVIVFFVATSINQDQWITIEFKVIFPQAYFSNNNGEAPFWLANKIMPGDMQYDSIGKKNVQILSTRQWGVQSKEIWVTAQVKAKYKPKQKKYTFLYQPLEIGRSIDIIINGSNIHGIITGIQGSLDSRPTQDIVVKARLIDSSSPYSLYTRGVEPWIAESIGDTDSMKDASGKVVAQILEKSIKPAERVSMTSDGRAVLSEDPIKKDVFLTLRLTVTKQGNDYMFLEDKPIIIGWSVPIFFDQKVLYPVITDIVN